MFQNLCRRKRTCRKKQPTTKTKAPTQLPGDLEPPGILVCAGKVVHDFRHQLNDMLLLKDKDVFFSQPRMGIIRTMTVPCYTVSEKRAPLWLILLETTIRTSGFIFLLNHSPSISLLFPICPFLFLFFSVPFPFSTLLSTFFHLLSPTVSLKHCRHAGLPLPVRRWLYLQLSLLPQADSTKLSAVQISVHAVLMGINPGTLFAGYSGILQCQGMFCLISTFRLLFWH